MKNKDQETEMEPRRTRVESVTARGPLVIITLDVSFPQCALQ